MQPPEKCKKGSCFNGILICLIGNQPCRKMKECPLIEKAEEIAMQEFAESKKEFAKRYFAGAK